jgi:hypothetical protein
MEHEMLLQMKKKRIKSLWFDASVVLGLMHKDTSFTPEEGRPPYTLYPIFASFIFARARIVESILLRISINRRSYFINYAFQKAPVVNSVWYGTAPCHSLIPPALDCFPLLSKAGEKTLQYEHHREPLSHSYCCSLCRTDNPWHVTRGLYSSIQTVTKICQQGTHRAVVVSLLPAIVVHRSLFST